MTEQILPLMDSYCADCHTGADAEGGLDLERYQLLKDLLADTKRWQRLKDRVRRGQMPPPDSEPLPEQEKERLLNWIDASLNSLDCTEANPGNVTIRRLNRVEYRNTIKSLTGVDYPEALAFPGDDVGYSFDNIADVLSLPPLLMERYLDAAEKITQQAIIDPKEILMDTQFPADDFTSRDKGVIDRKGTKVFFREGTMSKSIALPTAGRYEVWVNASQRSNEGREATLNFVKDGTSLGTVPLKTGRENPFKYRFTFTTKTTSPRRFRIGVIGKETDEEKPLSSSNRVTISNVAIRGPIEVDGSDKLLAYDATDRDHEEKRKMAQLFLNGFAERAFRRPVDPEQQQRLLQLYDRSYESDPSFTRAVRTVCQAILVTPQFLFRIERPVISDKSRALDDYELATSLSYFLWSDMPDSELFELAEKGELKRPKVMQQQVQRMLNDDRAKALLDNFGLQWLQLRSLKDSEPDPNLFPQISRQLLRDMNQETRLLFQDILRRDASLLELLDADFTYLNKRLAQHYGIPIEATISGFQRVELTPLSRFGGLLTHASVLTLTSNPNRTSPVKRGKWIMETLLGRAGPPPAPPGRPGAEPKELTGTLRQRLEQHRADPNCASCHETMDAFGFALENFDAVGRWRDQDEGLPIDSGTQLPDGTKIKGITGLRDALTNQLKREFIACLTEKMLIYALGRGLEYYDQCAIDEIVDKLERENYRFSALVLAVTESQPFKTRRGQSAPTNE
ncbi:MAG: DUF1592 domain-containing protein [Mariniblastus sp.]|nr:DUF1592 domain-containing protein [Mariniblastus sp.]